MKQMFLALPLWVEVGFINLMMDLKGLPDGMLDIDDWVRLELRKQYLLTKIDELW
jgi:hypothetical protein